ncbi:MAG: hypothetical protein JWO42_3100 [Chloroflexi bacterium]|nr:hypothetical protein [Chloroflexota bacterium]
MPDDSLTVFGIRHHGPGCARSLRAALEALAPDIVLVEGPPDAQSVLPLIMHEEMRPPVALLVYAPEHPRLAAYYPFTAFSPEWQALHYAFQQNIPARFMDLPQAVQLAGMLKPAPEEAAQEEPVDREPTGSVAVPAVPETAFIHVPGQVTPDPAAGDASSAAPQEDPIGFLAKIAGYDDRELWWEQQVEQRRDATDLFRAILEVMTALRNDAPPPEKEEAQREASMRQAIRVARKEGFQRIAVVCGAWHAPVLAELGPAKADSTLLSGLSRAAVTATWIPWTNSRLASRSGYGAGIESPGWYEHLWTQPEGAAARWITHAARLLRERDLDASSASVIEAVRLADALAALRNVPAPGLAELNEAILAVLCHGEKAPMALIRDRLEIGERLGEVPDETPSVPLQQDLAAWQRRLRLKPSAEAKVLDLDLRGETDRDRSRLLHRLQVLNVPWGVPRPHTGTASTFHELWQLQWQPEFAVGLIDAGLWGNTVEAAVTATIRHAAANATELPALTGLLDSAILAGLPGAVEHVLGAVQSKAALAADVRHLMDALPPLARVARYGDVRGTPVEHVIPVIDGLFERVVAGLASACASLDDDAAGGMVQSIANVQTSISLLQRADQLAEWQDALRDIIGRDMIHGLVRGWACRLLLEAGVLEDTELENLTRIALSPVNPAPQAASWVEGVLRGSGLLLLHQDGLWLALDRWLQELDGETFTAVLPLVRRSFSGFQPPERRQMGEKVVRLGGTSTRSRKQVIADDIEPRRAAAVLPVLARILGIALEDQEL